MATRFLGIALVTATVFSPPAARSQTGCLSGSVVDNNGQLLKGISVGLVEHTWRGDQLPVAQGMTDESGRFEIDGIPPGAYQASAANDALGYSGMWMRSRDVSIAASAICTRVTFNVGPPVAKLRLTVADAVSNRPIPGILLEVFPGDRGGLWLPAGELTKAGGVPKVPSLTKLRIVVTARGYSSSEFTFPSLAPGETREIVTKLSPRSLGCIRGIAVDDSFAPVGAATIDPRFMGRGYAGDVAPGQSDDAGKFTIDNVRPGEYVIYPEKESDGFSHNWSGWRGQVELQRVTVTAGGACEEVKINMGPRGALLRVRAMDGATHQPLPDIIVNFRNPENTRQGGAIIGEPREVHELLVPSRANVIIQVQASGYRPSEPEQVGPLAPGEKLDLTVSLQRQTSSAPGRP
jgi:hypothetical protein